jgi:hypothetical protein
MDRKNGDTLCDLVRNYAVAMEGMIVKTERKKYDRIELIDRLIKRSDLFTDALWALRGEHVYPDKR